MTKWIKRKKTKIVKVGDVAVGGDNPISIQSMTNTDTCDVVSTVKQINDLEFAGADIVRVSVPGFEENPSDPTLPAPMSGPIRVGYSIDWQLERQLYEDTYGALKKEGVFNDRLSGSNNPEKGTIDMGSFWSFVSGQYLPPEPEAPQKFLVSVHTLKLH